MHLIKKHIQASINVKQKILSDEQLLLDIERYAKMCVSAFKAGNKVILAGNGGSAADAQHIAAEFVSRFQIDRRPLPSLSLSTDTSIITAIGNDYGFEHLFSRQLKANGVAGDIFIGLSTSGNSENIVEAVKVCKELNIIPIIFTGGSGGDVGRIVGESIFVPSESTAMIQESHIMIGHIICGYVEDALFKKE